jgi:hypothetical protein
MMSSANDKLDCWDPAAQEAFKDLGDPPCPTDVGGDRRQTGLCGESQVDGVPCADPKRLCEICGRAHR